MEMIERKETVEQGKLLRRFILLSVALHMLVLTGAAIKALLFPSHPIEYLPSLRVDLVSLPDMKKTDQIQPKPAEPAPTAVPPQEQVKPKPQIKPDIKPEDNGDFAVQQKKKKAERAKKEKEAQKKLKAALERIKAIERIKALAGDEVKGNQISKGSALSGEAKTSLETTYFDVVLERVRSNWELPKWLQDQNLSAKVLVYVDARGQMKSFKFTKPSGNEQFDSEVKRTLQASSPFPLPPEAIVGDLSNGILLGFPL